MLSLIRGPPGPNDVCEATKQGVFVAETSSNPPTVCLQIMLSRSNFKAWDGLFSSSGIPAQNVIAVKTDLSPEEGKCKE